MTPALACKRQPEETAYNVSSYVALFFSITMIWY